MRRRSRRSRAEMPEHPGDPDSLGTVMAIRPVLALLADGARRSSDGVSTWSPDGWVMRTHPDLTAALEEAAGGTDLHLEMVYGIATLVGRASGIVAVGMGTGSAWLLVPDGPAFDKARDEGATPIDGLTGWLNVEAWRVDLAAWVRATAILTNDIGRSDA